MPKVNFDSFSESIQKIVLSMDEEEKLDFYQELLETGSAARSAGGPSIETFSIIDGLTHETIISASGDTDDDFDLQDFEDDMDDILNSDYTQNDIDLNNYDGDRDE